MKQKKRWIARQGDVLIERTNEAIPVDAAARAPEQGRVILAHGEVTGHAHALPATVAMSFGASDDAFWLRVDKPATVTHEEHAPVKLAPGNYKIRRQREYSPEEIRRVAD